MIVSDGLFSELRVDRLMAVDRENRPIDSDSRWKRKKFRTRRFPFEIKSEEI